MIVFKLDEYGRKIEFSPETRAKGELRLYLCDCLKCGKEHRYPSHTKIKTKKCSCEVAKKDLTHDGVTHSLKRWGELDPTIHVASARVRLSDRALGRRMCSDTEVLYGYKSTKTLGNILLRTDVQQEWRKVFITEFSRRINRLSLLDAIFETILVVSEEPDFCAEKKFNLTSVLTPYGQGYIHLGQSLYEIYDILQDVGEVKSVLLSEGVSPLELSKIFR